MRGSMFYVLGLLLAAPVMTAGESKPPVIPLTLPSGKVLQGEVMQTPDDRAKGLMFRPSLPEDRGLLFVFDEVETHAIWMKNCKFAIDIVWLDDGHKVVDVAEAVPPCKADPCTTYEPIRRARYVIELNARQAAREKLTLGSVVKFELPR